MDAPIIQRFVALCRTFDGESSGDELRSVTSEFLAECRDDPALASQAANALPDLGPAGAAWIAICLGTLVERGSDPILTCQELLRTMESWLPRLASPDDPAIRAFPMLCQAVVAHLARMPALRQELAADINLMRRIDDACEFSHGAQWVRETILRVSGTLIVVHPTSRTGYRLIYSNVATCFHLFSLIQTTLGVLVPGGRVPSQLISDGARGRAGPEAMQKLHDEAWWHYGDPSSPTPNLKMSIWGEAMVCSLPRVENELVILLWPCLMHSRGWNAGFYGPQIDATRPDMTIERSLTPVECDAWITRLGLEISPCEPTRPAAPPPKASPLSVLRTQQAKRTWWQRLLGRF
jgi:hypothetical protein